MAITRRQLLTRGALMSGAAGAGSLFGRTTLARSATTLVDAAPAGGAMPAPDESNLEHVVVVMMENRSFDHFLGWLPGADGQQAGLSFTDRHGIAHRTARLREFQGCGHPDPDHTWEGGRVQYNAGQCDGWLLGTNDEYSLGYYDAADLAFYGPAARYWTVCDRYFAAIMAGTAPNRMYLHAGRTDRLHNDEGPSPSTLPTIWDRLAGAGRTGTYYFSDSPFTARWGAKYRSISRPIASFYSDCATGTLPHVAYIDPRFMNETVGTSGDDHPHADIRVGQAFVNGIYEAVTSSSAWRHTVLVITYDEWGGFFDHVPPPVAHDTDPRCRLRGFRVPTIVISPFARRHHVAHAVYDHTSILKLIEWRWNLEPLAARDAGARNLAEVLDFRRPRLEAPRWPVPSMVGEPCVAADPAEFASWHALAELAHRSGFDVPRLVSV